MEDIVNYTRRCKRYVIRRTDNNTYYDNGCGRYFGDLESAKVYKNIGGAKTACNELSLRMSRNGDTSDLEIVEIMTISTNKVIPYIKK